MFHIRPAYSPAVIGAVRRLSRPSTTSVGRVPTPAIFAKTESLVGVGAEPDVWIVVTTKASRAFADKAQDLKAGDVVRFTAQYGLRAEDDTSNMISIRGKVVTPRNPITPDSYGIEAQEVADSYALDPSVPLPYVGQPFLVAPWSISAVESTAEAPAPGPTGEPGSAPPPPSPETPASPPPVSPDEMAGKAASPEGKTASPPPPPPPGAPPLPQPAKSRTGLYLGIGVAAAALIGLGTWYWWPVAA